MSRFINDWHTIINFGVHTGKRLIDVPTNYFEWMSKNVKDGPVHEAIVRIHNRKGITDLIKYQPIQNYIPDLKKDTNHVLPIISRPQNINFSLFGIFMEYLIKYHLGIKRFDEVIEYLALFGLATLPDHLKLIGPVATPTKRAQYIAKSFNKTDYNILDICNLSFSHSLLINPYKEYEYVNLFTFVKENREYFDDYVLVLKNFPDLPRLVDAEQETCDKISVGCVIGVIDLIHDRNIIDIKCCESDDLDYYRKQLFAYGCLHRLRYGNIIKYCKIFNFMTGTIYIMNFQNITDTIAKNHIKMLGNHCVYHAKLF